jgi:hypothetical protein
MGKGFEILHEKQSGLVATRIQARHNQRLKRFLLEELQTCPIIEEHPLGGWIPHFNTSTVLKVPYPLHDQALSKLNWGGSHPQAANTT